MTMGRGVVLNFPPPKGTGGGYIVRKIPDLADDFANELEGDVQ